MVPGGTSFIEACPPYDKSGCDIYLSSDGKSFSMAGDKYSDGILFWGGYALFNLDSKYSSVECTVGHTEHEQDQKTVSFIVDGKVVKKVELEPECLPKKISVPVSYGLQMKIVTEGSCIGIGSMTVK